MSRTALAGGLLVTAVVVLGVILFVNKYQQPLSVPQIQNKTTPTTSMETTKPATKKTYSAFPGALSADELEHKKAVITTKKGTIEIELFSTSPLATSNFIQLSRDGFYNGLTFHRVEPGFVIQGGDPSGNGTGGPGYRFNDEKVTQPYSKGIVAMANAGPNTNGSQFFIMLADHPDLPPAYTIFGKVVKGQEVVDQITVGDVMESVTIEDAQ